MCVELNQENYERWKLYIRNSVKFIDAYRHLIDTYVLDFFTEDLWSRIKPKWKEVLSSLTPRQLANFLNCDESLRQDKVWPLSLQAFRKAAFSYTLPRRPITSDDAFLSYLSKRCPDSGYCQSSVSCDSKEFETCGENDFCALKKPEADSRSTLNGIHPLQKTSVSWGDAFSELSPGAGQHKLLQHVFRRHLKPKKQHEVARLAYIAGKVAHCACDGVIIDVGSGQGHLSRFLAYGHDVRVVCLEAQDEFIQGAKKFDNQLEMAVQKMTKKFERIPPLPPPPKHSVCHLEPDIDSEVFRKIVTSAWPDLEKRGATCGLLGLHTCGDLAPTLLRIFSNLPTCTGLVSVGCCYMKLSVDNNDCNPGYPMSSCVKSLEGNRLSYEAREGSCHAIEMYVNRLQFGAENLKVHCYRAALEEIIIKDWPEHRHAGLRSVNHAHEMDFAEYAVAAVGRLKDVTLNKDDLQSERTRQNLDNWMRVVIYYSLRLMLAPVVESVILLDRLFFLYEKGVQSILLPVFDPKLSPRNHVLVAIKNKCEL